MTILELRYKGDNGDRFILRWSVEDFYEAMYAVADWKEDDLLTAEEAIRFVMRVLVKNAEHYGSSL